MAGISETSKAELIELINQYKLKEYEKLILASAKGYLYLKTSGVDTYAKLGNSRIGGVPDLPPTLDWPHSKNGYQSFVAQINLEELPELPATQLPKQGILYFFLGDYPRSINPHTVLYFNGDLQTLKKATQPPIEEFSSDWDWSVYEPCSVTIKNSFSLIGSIEEAKEIFASVMDTNARTFRMWLHEHWEPFLNELSVKRYNLAEYDSEISQILGQPNFLHINLMSHAQFVREGISPSSIQSLGRKPNADEVKKWVLLLELGSHDLARMQWSDMGFLDFAIHRDDLAKLDFTKTYCSIASS